MESTSVLREAEQGVQELLRWPCGRVHLLDVQACRGLVPGVAVPLGHVEVAVVLERASKHFDELNTHVEMSKK